VQASGFAERHEQNVFAAETYNLGINRKIVAVGTQTAKFA
jgi:hypothetical protein